MRRVRCDGDRPVRFSRLGAALAFAAAAIAHAAAAAAGAFDAAPLAVTDQSPFGQLYGVPALGDARVLAAGRWQVAVGAVAANEFVRRTPGAEQIVIDEETHRLSLGLRRGFGGGVEWTFELPWLAYGGGRLDGMLERWHNVFALPTEGRGSVPRNRLFISYVRDGVERVHLSEPVSGVGDLRMGIGKQLWDTPRRALALRLELKFPTGASDGLAGSGGPDVAAWASASFAIPDLPRWRAYGGGGLARLGGGAVLPDLQQRTIPFATLGLGWRAIERLELLAQVDAHRAFYHRSILPPLGHPVAQITLGGRIALAADTALELALQEDLAPSTTQDVALQAVLKWRF